MAQLLTVTHMLKAEANPGHHLLASLVVDRYPCSTLADLVKLYWLIEPRTLSALVLPCCRYAISGGIVGGRSLDGLQSLCMRASHPPADNNEPAEERGR